jgi:hypothetical protein
VPKGRDERAVMLTSAPFGLVLSKKKSKKLPVPTWSRGIREQISHFGNNKLNSYEYLVSGLRLFAAWKDDESPTRQSFDFPDRHQPSP